MTIQAEVIVPIQVIITYERKAIFERYDDKNSQLLDKDGNPIEVYWKPERTHPKLIVSYNDISMTFGDLFTKFQKEFEYGYVHMTYEKIEDGLFFLKFSFEAGNKNVFDNVYFALRAFLCNTFKCLPIIF